MVTGGYDKCVRLFDLRENSTGALKKTFTGHNSSVSCVLFNPAGNFIISGQVFSDLNDVILNCLLSSKDCSIKFWDIISGLCLKSITSPLGEVTSLEINSSGNLLLSGSKDNSNRLWDLRDIRPVSKNLMNILIIIDQIVG